MQQQLAGAEGAAVWFPEGLLEESVQLVETHLIM